MTSTGLDIVILGLSITSSWGNGHATTFRALVRELSALGHNVLFLERDLPWYADNRDMPKLPWGRVEIYDKVTELRSRFAGQVANADVVIVGSYVPEGIDVGRWVNSTAGGVKAFYDIDTPVTLAKLERGDCDYVTPALIAKYDLYLSFTGGPTLTRLEEQYGSPMARPLYCSVDLRQYYPEQQPILWDLGYLGTYSADRQPPIERLMFTAARRWKEGRFAVFGPQYPTDLRWPANVLHDDHLAPAHHRAFYNRQRFTLNVTRADMVAAGYSPSVRLFEAAACGTPIISDFWVGLDELFVPGEEILIARNASDTLRYLRELPENQRLRIGRRARDVVINNHTSAHRAAELVSHLRAVVEGKIAPPVGAMTVSRNGTAADVKTAATQKINMPCTPTSVG
jgi:spore maturation protein CgeB